MRGHQEPPGLGFYRPHAYLMLNPALGDVVADLGQLLFRAPIFQRNHIDHHALAGGGNRDRLGTQNHVKGNPGQGPARNGLDQSQG